VIALLFILFALLGSAFGTSSGEGSVTTAPPAPIRAPRAPVTQTGLAPAAKPCVTMLKTPCNARSGPKP
jgi:hypothetical protein